MQLEKLIPVGVALLILAGCASVPMGDPQRDAELKTFSAPQEKAAIYVYRDGNWASLKSRNFPAKAGTEIGLASGGDFKEILSGMILG